MFTDNLRIKINFKNLEDIDFPNKEEWQNYWYRSKPTKSAMY